MSLFIHGAGCFHPKNILDNLFFENLGIETDSQWITERVGISERRTVLPLDYIKDTKNSDPRKAKDVAIYTNSDLACHAGEIALRRAGLKPSDIGCVIVGAGALDYHTPAQASVVACDLGIKAPAFDLIAGCATFLAQIHFVHQMKPETPIDYFMLIQSENITTKIDYSDRRSSILFGDGAAATIVSLRHRSPYEITTTNFDSDVEKWKEIQIPRDLFVFQNGSSVQKFAINRTIQEVNAMLTKTSIAMDRYAFIGHQANGLMLEAICRRIAVTDARHFSNCKLYGNQASASAPSVLAQQWDNLGSFHDLIMCVVGAGLSWGTLHLSISNTATN